MKFALGCELGYRVDGPTTFLLNLHPARLDRQIVLHETLTITPDAPVETFDVPETGNRLVRFRASSGDLRVAYAAEVAFDPLRHDPSSVPEVPVGELPFAVLPHLNPSRYCQADLLPRLAVQEFGALPAGHDRVQAICSWIHDHVAYVRGSSDVHTSAGDTLVERAGVCRDFAHLGVALCRALGIPARFVSAYAWRLDPQDFHAVFEAYLGGRWYLFDPTRQAALDGLVRIGIGRDAADVSFATINGPASPTTMAVRIDAAPEDATADRRTTEAISLSDR